MDLVEVAINRNLRRHLASVVDLVATIQILQVYIHDQSIYRLAVSAMLQYSVLSPVFHAIRDEAPPPNRKLLMAVLLGNQVVALCCHAILSLPSPGPDGRLHGRLMMEFIGVTSVNRLWLIWWDLCIALLQSVSFTINFPIPERAAATEDAGTGESLSLLDSPPVPLSQIMTGSAIIYTCDILRTMGYNWKYTATQDESASIDTSSTTPSSPTSIGQV